MSAPIIWILIPLIVSIILWLIRSNRFLVALIASAVCLALALVAWFFPIGGLIRLGPISTEISPLISIFGRRFILTDGDRFLLVFLFAFGAFWFFGEGILQKTSLFIPVGLATLSLSVASLAVEPFLYAALIVEMIVLLSIPVLVPEGTRVGQGVLRYLIFQTLAMAFILLAGWASGGVEADPTNQRLLIQALVFLGLGFSFWLAIFPFYTWIPLLVSEVIPYQAGFLLNFLPQIVLLLALDYINAFSWLREYPHLPDILKFVGAIMIATGGLWAAFQQNILRLLGYAMIVEVGFSLLALGLHTRIGYELYISMFLPRMVSLALASLALSTFKTTGFHFKDLRGLIRKQPVSSTAVLVSLFSLSGLPLLGIFPLRQVLLENISEQSTMIVLWSIVGVAGLMFSSIRVLLVLISSQATEWTWSEDWPSVVLLIIGIVTVFLLGTVPAWFLPGMKNLLNAFGNLLS